MHKHRSFKREVRCYETTAIGAKERPEAHGGICTVSFCRCGAKREVNSNGRAVEQGTWYGGKEVES